MNGDAVKRFWLRTDKKDDDKCWEWMARITPDGYGILDYDNKGEKAHRVSWRIHFGDIPKDMVVCHKCDNRKCVNPKHLFIGTQRDNVLDMVNKGRQRSQRGSLNTKARLTEEGVSKIKELRKKGLQYKEIARMFGVSVGCVNHILNGRHWGWVK